MNTISTNKHADEKRGWQIINSLLVISMTLGFACFVLIVLPRQLRLAGALTPTTSQQAVSANISAIVELNTPEAKKQAKPTGGFVKFTPEPTPPYGEAPKAEEDNRIEEDQVAGGAGAAIEDFGSESEPLIAYSRQRPRQEKETESTEEAVTDQLPSARTSRFKVHPISSISRGDPSVLDSERGMQKKPWLSTPKGLEADVAFWRDIYAKYDRNQVVMHHPRHLNIVYDIVALSDIEKDVRLNDVEKLHMREKRVEERRTRITNILKKLSGHPQASTLSDEEWRIKKLFQGIEEDDVFKRAADEDSVRSQTGQRDKFILGLKYSGRYMGEIEAIFESYDLPKELTRLIFVESMFNPYAVSSAGASGIFQFMRSTGRLYLKINDIVDERNDPLAAAHAAARLLRQDFNALGRWPLAINAYNTGRGRMQQAMAQVGTSDIGKIIKGFDHPAYGFASRNFFLEFLAALDVAEHAERYFGPIEYDKPLRYETVSLNYNISLPEVGRVASIPLDDLLELNPALTPRVASGQKLIPIGFSIRVPEKKTDIFLAAASRAPKSRRGAVRHVVEAGETIESLAKMYGVTAEAIIGSNKLISRRLHTGQMLVVPVDEKIRK